MVESVVLDHAASDVVFLAGSTGDRCGSGVCLQAAGVGEAAAVVAGFGEDACRELDSEAGEAQEYLGIRVLAKADVNCFGEIFTGLAGCFELLQQSEELLAEGVLDSCGLVCVLGPKGAAQAVSLLVNAAKRIWLPICWRFQTASC